MMRTDVRPEPDVEEDEPARFNRRRMVRWVTVLTLGIVAVLALWQDPTYAG